MLQTGGKNPEQGGDININIDKAQALLLGERARTTNIDLEWDLDEEMPSTKNSSVTESKPDNTPSIFILLTRS